MSTNNISRGAYTTMTVTNLHSLAPSLTACWQSARVSDLSTKALDYEILVHLAAVNTAPANNKVISVFVSPWVNDDSSNWYPADNSNGTILTGSEGTVTIATPHNMRLLGVIYNYTQNTVCSNSFLLSNAFGQFMPDGWSLVIQNYTGMTFAGSGNIVAYRAITETNA